MSCVRPSGWSSVLCGKNFNAGCYIRTVQSNFFIPVLLIGTIDFYHFIPFSLTLTLPGGHKVSFIFSTLFIRSGWNLIWRWSNPNWTSWNYFREQFYWKKGKIAAVLQTVKKTLLLARNRTSLNDPDISEWIWLNLAMIIDTIVLYILILV